MLCTFELIDPQNSLVLQVVDACRASLRRGDACTRSSVCRRWSRMTQWGTRPVTSQVWHVPNSHVPYTAVRSTWKYIAQKVLIFTVNYIVSITRDLVPRMELYLMRGINRLRNSQLCSHGHFSPSPTHEGKCEGTLCTSHVRDQSSVPWTLSCSRADMGLLFLICVAVTASIKTGRTVRLSCASSQLW